MRKFVACLFMLAVLAGGPGAGAVDAHEATPAPPCPAAAAQTDCGIDGGHLSTAADTAACDGSTDADRHCCPDPHCVYAQGGLLPRGATLLADQGAEAGRPTAVNRPDGVDTGPGSRPPRRSV